MLVYANHLKAFGMNTKAEVLRAVGGWLKEQLGYGLHPDKLVTAGEHTGNRNGSSSWLKIIVASDGAQELYSWILKNADDSVRGRQWNSEIGLKVVGDSCELSCVVATEDASTLVLEPVQASRPRLIRYVVSNLIGAEGVDFDASVPGLTVKRVGASADCYRALLYDIENAERDYPIVLVSPHKDGVYPINADHLQQDLVGLAQVVKVETEFDSYDMEEILGRRWSAWDGAVNVLHMPTSSGYIKSRLFLFDVIEEWGNTQHSRVSQILAWVTHNTNIPRLRKRIRPEGVMRLAFRQSLSAAKERRQELTEHEIREELDRLEQAAEEQNQWVKLLEDTNTNLEHDVQQLRLDLDERDDELSKERRTVNALKEQLRNSGAHTSTIDGEQLLLMLSRSDVPEPHECLELIDGDRCEVLDSAKRSAKESNQFVKGRQLLDLLIRLVTQYRTVLLEKGDVEARNVFGKNEFAAKESETVMGNSTLRRAREFEYQGVPLEMFRHLKIGVADDLMKTIRVYFHWDNQRKKIIIGYCGKHLPVSSH
jgi:hypothetical protein